MKPLCLLFASAFILSAQSSTRNPRPLDYDTNRDGVVDRREWRGTMQSFRDHDWNRDGVISGDELHHARDERQTRSRSAETAGRLDKNQSGVVEGHEWPYNSQIFHDLDRDGDSVLSPEELQNISSATLPRLDQNKDGRIDENEWPGGFAEFERLDQDNNGRISSQEYFERGGEWQRRQRFDAWDRNKDGRIQSTEWKSGKDLFHRLDTDRDSVLSWDEFMASTEQYDRPYGWR